MNVIIIPTHRSAIKCRQSVSCVKVDDCVPQTTMWHDAHTPREGCLEAVQTMSGKFQTNVAGKCRPVYSDNVQHSSYFIQIWTKCPKSHFLYTIVVSFQTVKAQFPLTGDAQGVSWPWPESFFFFNFFFRQTGSTVKSHWLALTTALWRIHSSNRSSGVISLITNACFNLICITNSQ